MERVTLKHLVARYKQDKEFLQTHPENRELLEKRIRRHEKDIAELPDIVKEGLIITPVKTMDEVLAKALV